MKHSEPNPEQALLVLGPAPAELTLASAKPGNFRRLAQKYREGNPVLGGSLGTCFDVSLLREEGRYRMWFSWRPKKSVALVESTNGTDWSRPSHRPRPQILSLQWEADINRPVVVKKRATGLPPMVHRPEPGKIRPSAMPPARTARIGSG